MDSRQRYALPLASDLVQARAGLGPNRYAEFEGASVLSRLRLLFVHIPKTAGTSVAQYLTTLDPSARRKLSCLQRTQHLTLVQIKDTLGARRLKELTSFAVVRNPFDRFCSTNFYLRTAPRTRQHMSAVHSMDDFAAPAAAGATWLNEVRSIRPQLGFIRDGNAIGVDRIVRFESPGARADVPAAEAGVRPLPPLPHSNASQRDRPGYRDHYSALAMDTVARLYADDLEVLGYAF